MYVYAYVHTYTVLTFPSHHSAGTESIRKAVLCQLYNQELLYSSVDGETSKKVNNQHGFCQCFQEGRVDIPLVVQANVGNIGAFKNVLNKYLF